MTSDRTFVIVGASLAGAKAAETLRAEGFDERVVLVGAEDERPYERPPLSKDYLRGEAERETVYVHPEGFYADHDIELRLGRTAVSVDVAGSELALDDGERLRYDRLLLATGAEPRSLSIPGGDLDGVLYLRSVADCDALRASTGTRRHGRRHRGGLDRRRGRRLGTPARPGRHGHRPAHRPTRARARHRSGRRLPRHPRRPRGPDAARDRSRGLRGRHGGRARPYQRRTRARLRLRGRRRRRAAAHRAGRPGRARRRQRHPRRRAPAHERAGRLRRRRRRQRPPPLLRRAHPRRALGQRAAPRTGRGPRDARPRRRLRPPALLLLRPIRRRHGVRGLRPRLGPRRSSAAIPRPASSSPSGSPAIASSRA